MARVALLNEPIWSPKRQPPVSERGAASVAYGQVREQEARLSDCADRCCEAARRLEGAAEGEDTAELEAAVAAAESEREELTRELEKLRADAARVGAAEIASTLSQQSITNRYSFQADLTQVSEVLSSVSAVGAAHAAAPSRGMTPRGMTPRGMTPRGMTPRGMTPRGMTPRGTTPGGMTPRGTTPRGTTPGGLTSRGMTPRASSSHDRGSVNTPRDALASTSAAGPWPPRVPSQGGSAAASPTPSPRRLSPLGDVPLTRAAFEAAQKAFALQRMHSKAPSLLSQHAHVPSTSLLRRVPLIATQPGLPDDWHAGLPPKTAHGLFSALPYHVEPEFEPAGLDEPYETGSARRSRLEARFADAYGRPRFASTPRQASFFGMPPPRAKTASPVAPLDASQRSAWLDALAMPRRVAETAQTQRERVGQQHGLSSRSRLGTPGWRVATSLAA